MPYKTIDGKRTWVKPFPFSHEWFNLIMFSMSNSRPKHLLSYFLRWYPFYRGDDFHGYLTYFTINYFSGKQSWKKWRVGFQWQKPRLIKGETGGINGGPIEHYSGWVGFHLYFFVIEFHFMYGHKGYGWYKDGGNLWYLRYSHLNIFEEMWHRFKLWRGKI